MNFNRLFILVLVAVLVVLGQQQCGVDAAPRWKFGKKLEKVGKNVFNAAKKALPVVAGYKALGR